MLLLQQLPRSQMSRSSLPAARPRSTAPSIRIAARHRRDDRGSTDRRALNPTIARWPLDLDEATSAAGYCEPAVAIVRESLADYRSGRADLASRSWGDDIAWWVRGEPPVGGRWEGPEGVFAYHALLEHRSGGTFRQRLIALEGSRGSIVDAYLRTTASRDGRHLDIPTLAVFELRGGRIRRVTELPGDHDAWEAFWAD
jgi:ketosteroid isomerase-like protein